MQDPRYQEDFFFQGEQTLSEAFQSTFSIFQWLKHCGVVRVAYWEVIDNRGLN